jgi:5S rRNA maturation endonuclease (ribonuclease M5)
MPGAEQVFVCEGATDTAALMTAGIPVVVGRPSCTGGVADVSWALNRYQDRQRPVVIVADSDVPGLDGACLLASQICGRFDSVVIAPTWYKDAREVCENGGGLLSIIDAVAGRNNKFWERVPT